MTAAPPWQALYPPGLRWDFVPHTQPLPALLDRAVAQFGPRPALSFEGEVIGFDALGARVDRLARGLAAAGVRPGDRVALLLPNHPAHPVALFAALRLGAIAVHLSPLDPARAIRGKIEDSGATTLVTAAHPGVLPQALAARGLVHRLVVAHGPAAPPVPDALNLDALDLDALDGPALAWPAIDVHDTALLQYTGGTTGQPRAARLTHANLSAATAIYGVWNQATGRGFRPSDRMLCVLPLFHIYALTAVLLRTLSSGTELVLHPRFHVDAVLDAIEHGRCTHMNGVPTMWIALVNAPGIERRDLSSLRVAGSGGAGLPAEVAQRFHTLTGLHMGGGWGMTETAPAGTNLLPGIPAVPGEIGVPLPGITLQVVDLADPSRVLPPNQTGELRVRGPNVTPGYWNRPEEDRAAFAEGWLLTGDVGLMRPDGRFLLADRKKDMILSGGFNVYPLAIEAAIHEHPDVAEAAVIGVPDPYRGQAAMAFLVLRPGAPPLTLAALRNFLADRLGRHELPTALELRDSLPRTPVGKLNKRGLAPTPIQPRQEPPDRWT